VFYMNNKKASDQLQWQTTEQTRSGRIIDRRQ